MLHIIYSYGYSHVGEISEVLAGFECESVTNISKLSSTKTVSNIRHQHRCNDLIERDLYNSDVGDIVMLVTY